MENADCRNCRASWTARLATFFALAMLASPLAAPLRAQPETSQAPALSAAALTPVSMRPPVNDPPPPLLPEEMGDLQMVRKRYQAAIEAFEQVNPKTATVWNKIGIAQQQMFNTDAAKRSYETSLKIDPKNPDVLNNLGTVYYSMALYALAEHSYRKALKLRPHSALILKNLGTDLFAEDKFNKGWECYRNALAADPDIFSKGSQLRIGEPTPTGKRGAMNYFLAKSYAQAGMSDLAVTYLRMAIDEGFTDPKRILADKELAVLRGQSAFEQLLSEQRSQ